MDMMKVGAALKRLEVKGEIDPAAVVEAARDPENFMHEWFTWDDTEAARRFRLTQAKELIRTVKVIVTVRSVDLKAPGYIRNPNAPRESGTYLNIARVKNEEDTARAVMVEEMKRISSAIAHAKQVAAALNEDGALAEIESLVASLKRRLDADPLNPIH